MNMRQKVGYTLLGAVIMFIGCTAGQIVSTPVTAQQEVFGNIVCTGLTVVDEQGKLVAIIDSDSFSRAIRLFDKEGEWAVRLVNHDNLGNWATVFDNGTRAVSISALKYLGGNVSFYGKDGSKIGSIR